MAAPSVVCNRFSYLANCGSAVAPSALDGPRRQLLRALQGVPSAPGKSAVVEGSASSSSNNSTASSGEGPVGAIAGTIEPLRVFFTVLVACVLEIAHLVLLQHDRAYRCVTCWNADEEYSRICAKHAQQRSSSAMRRQAGPSILCNQRAIQQDLTGVSLLFS